MEQCENQIVWKKIEWLCLKVSQHWRNIWLHSVSLSYSEGVHFLKTIT